MLALFVLGHLRTLSVAKNPERAVGWDVRQQLELAEPGHPCLARAGAVSYRPELTLPSVGYPPVPYLAWLPGPRAISLTSADGGEPRVLPQ
jgi:hypothetical protein